MEHVNIKIFAADSPSVRFADAIPVFHRWIQSRDLPELLIDVADYSHVPAGPGVVLIGLEANYALDNAHNRPGLLYVRKATDGAPASESLTKSRRLKFLLSSPFRNRDMVISPTQIPDC